MLNSHFKNGMHFGLGVLTALGAVILAGFCIYAFFVFDKLNAFAEKYTLLSQNPGPNKNEMAQIQALIAKGKIVSAEELLNYSMMYYDTFITILITLLGMSALLGFIYIRGVTRKEAEEEVHNAVNEYFEKESTANRINAIISDEVADWYTDDIGDRESIEERLNRLDEMFEVLNNRIVLYEDFFVHVEEDENVEDGENIDGNN